MAPFAIIFLSSSLMLSPSHWGLSSALVEKESVQLDLERLELGGVPLSRLLTKIETAETSRKAFINGGRNTSLDIANFVNGILSTDYGDGTLVKDEQGWVRSILYRNSGLEVPLIQASAYDAASRKHEFVSATIRVHFESSDSGVFRGSTSWNLNAKTRYPKVLVHMGIPALWNVGDESGSGPGFRHGSTGKMIGRSIVSPDDAIEEANLRGPSAKVRYLRGITYEAKGLSVSFSFGSEGTLQMIEIWPLLKP